MNNDNTSKTNRSIPVTIITGFLGAGKTTLINKLINENKDTKFALLINEFGEVGIDGEIIATSEQKMAEISSGCLCCVIRDDLIGTVKDLIKDNDIDHILIETSGLAEPAPIANTFLVDNLGGKINLQSIICLIDGLNFENSISNYKILIEQLAYCDIAVLNKTQLMDISEEKKNEFIVNLKKLVRTYQPMASILENTNTFSSSVLIDNILDLETYLEKKNKSKDSKDCDICEHENHEHHNHHDHVHTGHAHKHEHEEFDEVVYKTFKMLDSEKLDKIFLSKMPTNIIRAKGFLRIKGLVGIKLFQMVGTNKTLDSYTFKKDSKIDQNQTTLVMIGKNLDTDLITSILDQCLID